MNYRHAFHAGNFADVVKHATLALLIERLKAKDTAFRVIDTHAGVGMYDLAASEATRTGEWHEGIERLWSATRDPKLDVLLAPYLTTVAAANNGGPPRPLSWLAVDRAASVPQAGPVDGRRTSPGRCRGAGEFVCRRCAGAHDRARRMDGAQRLRAAEGAPRAGAGRPAVRGARRFPDRCSTRSLPRTASGRPAFTPCGTR